MLPTGCGADTGLASRGWNSIWKCKDYCYESPMLFYFHPISFLFSISPPFLSPPHFLLFIDTLDLWRRLATHIHRTSLWIRETKEHKCYVQLLVGKCPCIRYVRKKKQCHCKSWKYCWDSVAPKVIWTLKPHTRNYESHCFCYKILNWYLNKWTFPATHTKKEKKKKLIRFASLKT